MPLWDIAYPTVSPISHLNISGVMADAYQRREDHEPQKLVAHPFRSNTRRKFLARNPRSWIRKERWDFTTFFDIVFRLVAL
jgi:hypothetical protein